MLIKNTQPNVKHIDIGDGHILTLLPGVNSVDSGDWDKAKKSDLVTIWVREGWLVPGYPDQSIATLSTFTPEEALRLVADTVDLRLLRGWREDAGPTSRWRFTRRSRTAST